MDKGKCIFRVLLIFLIMQSLIVHTGEEKQGWLNYIKGSIQDKMSSVYRYFFMPKPNIRLLFKKSCVLGKELYPSGRGYTTYTGFLFKYDVSHDNDTLKALRKRLNISGLYLQKGWQMDGGNLNWYETKHKQINRQILDCTGTTVSQEYKERGFDENDDNSIAGCLYRLFDEIKTTLSTVGEARLELKRLSEPYTGKKLLLGTVAQAQKSRDLAQIRFNEALKKQSDNEKDWKSLLWELENAIVQQVGHDFNINSQAGSGLSVSAYDSNGFNNPIPAIWKKYTYYFDKNEVDKYSLKVLNELLGLQETKPFGYLNVLTDLIYKNTK